MDRGSDLYTIGQLARRVGVPTRTVRFWSDQGVLPPVDRSGGGYRRYDAVAVARLELIRTLRDLGLGLDAIAALLASQVTLAGLAAAHAAALDAQIRTLRLRRAVLRAVARRQSTTEEMTVLHKLARLSAQERQHVIDDFVATAFDGPSDPDSAVVAGWMRELPAELPDDPTDEQIDAWLELAELVADEGFQGTMRAMAPSTAGDPRWEFGLNLRPLVLAHAGSAVDDRVAPDSAAGRDTLDRIVPVDLPARETAAYVTWLEMVADARIERYWHLLATLNGAEAGPPAVPAFAWLLAAMRAHRCP
ncbi:MerR family transcriptional regulator [Dactylosporangium aurantiacum]|uniref:MerR family transcriptional regulator n=1 Tax=Dactylosporangium aurantiacum TaxID=35754 RepID=A0A9Q9MEJ9_9ACTN|nr:MerR family transcriptional regulator [Dactylosporangium aurantiacum]MDG6104984.1 MerR family transcriptional regulator [Dactylosporangium aurantiacum]UWZ51520.1 MerR family transcriptional regulator [Dactylosporangium aurantiacum]